MCGGWKLLLNIPIISAGGRVMASCGKANLLLTSKFKQYRGLCAEFEVCQVPTMSFYNRCYKNKKRMLLDSGVEYNF